MVSASTYLLLNLYLTSTIQLRNRKEGVIWTALSKHSHAGNNPFPRWEQQLSLVDFQKITFKHLAFGLFFVPLQPHFT